MELPTGLLALVVAIIVGAFVAQPYFSRRGEGGGQVGRRTAQALRQQADLLAERNRIYAAVRDLDFDYKTNKVSDEDYTAQRYALVARGVEVLQQLDGLPALDEAPGADPVEAAVAALRAGSEGVPAASPGKHAAGAEGFCPQCGGPVFHGDRFCGSCGASLAA
jgi:hypothetical protein